MTNLTSTDFFSTWMVCNWTVTSIGRPWRSLMILRVRILGVIGEAQSESFLIPSTKKFTMAREVSRPNI